MKKIFLTFSIVVLSAVLVIAQSPNAFKYQAVARNASGAVLDNQSVSFLISILRGSTTGTVVYSETNEVQTNAFGLVTLEIGNGSVLNGIFTDIDWGGDTYFLQLEMDETGGTNYLLMGVVQLLSVPYAKYSNQTRGVAVKSNSEILEIESPSPGMLVVSSTDEQLYIYTGNNWIKTTGTECFPMDVAANAGEDQLVEAGEVSTLLEANTPLYGTGAWTILSGSGGVIAEPSNPVSLFTGEIGQLYILRWDITWQCNSTYDEVEILISYACPGSPTLTDVDGNVYNTIQLGDQCWMAENLNTGTISSNSQTNNELIEKYCYMNTSAGCGEYGGYYTWDETMQYTNVEGVQGICPDGWHIPTFGEWCTMSQFIDPTVNCEITPTGTDIGLKMKSISGWNSGGNGTNESGFNALPAGFASTYKAETIYLGQIGGFWTSTEYGDDPSLAKLNSFDSSDAMIYFDNYFKVIGWSVRCIKD